MSMPTPITIRCPKCGAEVKITMWRTLNADVSPEQTKKLLAAELFNVECPRCHKVTTIAYPMLYHDMTNKLLVYLAWREEDIQQGLEMLAEFHRGFGDSYSYRLVRNDRELVEKAMIFKAGLDDRIIEIIKDIQRSDYPSRFGTPAPEVVFLINQDDPEEWCFLHLGEPSRSQHVSRDLYERAVKDFLPFFNAGYDDNLQVNEDWVTQFLNDNPKFSRN